MRAHDFLPVQDPGAQPHALLYGHANNQRSRKGAAVRLQWNKCCTSEASRSACTRIPPQWDTMQARRMSSQTSRRHCTSEECGDEQQPDQPCKSAVVITHSMSETHIRQCGCYLCKMVQITGLTRPGPAVPGRTCAAGRCNRWPRMGPRRSGRTQESRRLP